MGAVAGVTIGLLRVIYEMNIRKFQPKDVYEVALLAMKTFQQFNSDDIFDEAGLEETLAAFDPAKNTEEQLLEKFAVTPVFYVAEDNNHIIAFIRGTVHKITSLFVDGAYHKQ